MKQTNCENWKDNPSPPKKCSTAFPEGARHQWRRRSRPGNYLAKRRKPPGSGANACGPGAKNVGAENVGVKQSVRREHRAASRAGRLTPLRSFVSRRAVGDGMYSIRVPFSDRPEGAKQVSPGQSDEAQPRSAALGKRPTPHVRRPEGARQMRHKCSTNPPQTRETERRNDPNADVTRDVADSFCPSKPANRGHPLAYGSQWFVITSHNRSCRAPSGRWILGGPSYPGRRIAAPPRRSALG